MELESTIGKKEKRAFSFRDVFGYFMGDFGCNFSFTLISSYMFIFYTQYIGVSLAHYSIIILITKILDGINDPIIGSIVDRLGTNKKGDKFKHWILIGAPILAISATLLFIDASTWNYTAKILLCIGGYVAWDIAYTVVNVPYGSLASVMTARSSQRSALSTARSWGGILAGLPLGIIIPMFVYGTVVKDGSEVSVFLGERMLPIAIILGVISLVCFAILYMNVEERIEHVEPTGEQEKFSYLQTLKDFLKNRAVLGISLASLSQILFISGAGQLTQLTYQLYYNDGSLSSYSIFTYLIPMVIGTIIGTPLVGRIGKKEMSTWPLLVTAAVFGLMYFIEVPNPYIWIGLLILANSFSFALTLYTWAMVGDAIDFQEWKTGKRAEGSIYATYSMLRKIGQGFGQAFVPAIIAILIPTLSLTDSATWTSENVVAIRDMSVLFPMVGYVIIFLCMKFIYNLDKETVKEMQIELGRED